MEQQRLLVVDDDPRIGRLIARSVKGMGFIVHILHRPEELKAVYRGFQPDVILLDLKMPDVDGIQVLRQLADWGCGARILILSGVGDEILRSAERLGCMYGLNMDAVLQKPVAIEEIKKCIEELVDTENVQTAAYTPAAHAPISEASLSAAIECDELVVHYQPKVARRSNHVIGVEALVRWLHPNHGLIPPDRFIPLAEEAGLIAPLTFKVMESAFRDIKKWVLKQHDFKLALNISLLCLADRDFPDKLAEMLEKHNLEPDQLMLEITESEATGHPVHLLDTFTRLRLKGVHFSMDDFGMGKSTLERLRNFPYSELKVDKSFVMDAMETDGAAEIVRSTVELGHSLGLKVVAEGIENQRTLDWLFGLGCDLAQGFHLSPPLDVLGFGTWLEEWRKNHTMVIAGS